MAAAGGQGPGVRSPQRRSVALVVIMQIQWLCPGATQAPEFLNPLDKNYWRRPCIF